MFSKITRQASKSAVILVILFSIINAGISQPVNILPLGNSITQSNSSNYSYRYPLWTKLIDDGVLFDYVGTKNTNFPSSPSFPPYNGETFDPDHEGHWGLRADEIDANLATWLGSYTPDIVLLHIGSNDIIQGQSISSTIDEIKSIITTLRNDNPQVIILLAQIIPYINAANPENVPLLNAEILLIPDELYESNSPILIVDQYTGFDPVTDTYDGVHPNSSGEEKMAEKWRVAINDALYVEEENFALEFEYETANPKVHKRANRVTFNNIPPTSFSGLTMEAWCKLDDYYEQASSGSYIFCRQHINNHFGPVLVILSDQTVEDPMTIGFGLDFENASGFPHVGLHTNSVFPLNEWHHIAATWDGSFMKIYMDGNLEASVDVSALGQYYDPATTFYIGWRNYYLVSEFDGALDECRIWSYARTEEQIRETMHTELSGTESGLFAYWNFNQQDGQDVLDLGPNGYHGVLGDDNTVELKDPIRIASTAPLPYNTVQNGDWNIAATWDTWQTPPEFPWSVAQIDHSVNVSANETIGDVTINPGAAVTVNNGITFQVDDLNIKSDNTGTGSFINNGSFTSSTASVEQFLSADQWHYIGSSVANQQAGVFSGIYLREWDEASEDWTYITNASAPLTDMKGYASWAATSLTGDATISYSGTLNDGAYAIALTNTPGTTAPPGEDPTGYNFVSNPYPSGIDWDGAGWTKTNVDNAIYVITYQGGVRQYGSYVGGVGTHGVTNEIAPHQGFFVKCNDVAGGNLQVSNAARIHTSQEFFKGSQIADDIIRLRIDGNGLFDETVIRINEQANLSYDSQYDAFKMKGAETAPQLYSYLPEGNNLSINTISAVSGQTVIPLGFECGTAGIYELQLNDIEGFNGFPVLLEDKQDNRLVNLKNVSAYKFAASADDDPLRFNLRFSGNDMPANTNGNLGDLVVLAQNSEISIYLTGHENASVSMYDLSGRLVYKGRIVEGENRVKPNYTDGYILVKVIANKELFTEKVFLK